MKYPCKDCEKRNVCAKKDCKKRNEYKKERKKNIKYNKKWAKDSIKINAVKKNPIPSEKAVEWQPKERFLERKIQLW